MSYIAHRRTTCFVQTWVNQSIQVLSLIPGCSEHFRQNLGEHISKQELNMILNSADDLQTSCEKSSLSGQVGVSVGGRSQQQRHLLSMF